MLRMEEDDGYYIIQGTFDDEMTSENCLRHLIYFLQVFFELL